MKNLGQRSQFYAIGAIIGNSVLLRMERILILDYSLWI